MVGFQTPLLSKTTAGEMSAIGVKRTSRFAPQMSANDPKRTYANPFQVLCFVCPAFVPETAMRRREFISLIGGVAATWPLAVLAQQVAMPVVGYLSSYSPEEGESRAAPFRLGLQEAGYVVGRNVAIEYRWADQQIDRLPAMAADLVQRHVNVIAATTTLRRRSRHRRLPRPFRSSSRWGPTRFGLVSSLT